MPRQRLVALLEEVRRDPFLSKTERHRWKLEIQDKLDAIGKRRGSDENKDWEISVSCVFILVREACYTAKVQCTEVVNLGRSVEIA